MIAMRPATLAAPDSPAMTVGSSGAGVANYSYGLVQNVVINKLINSNVAARVLVPLDGALGTSWTANGFDDTGWRHVAHHRDDF